MHTFTRACLSMKQFCSGWDFFIILFFQQPTLEGFAKITSMHVLSSSALKEWLVWTIQHLKLELHVGLAPLDCREMVEFVQVSPYSCFSSFLFVLIYSEGIMSLHCLFLYSCRLVQKQK